ncbi:MAG: TolC family protein, partial [Firmicutes bacterium]|nr:TolC family protein [Bacillota bacterium]
ELLQARTNVRKLEASLTRLKNARLPSVKISATEKQGLYTATVTLDLVTGDLQWSAGGSWEESAPFSIGEETEMTPDGFNLGLELTWQPFDGGARKAQIAALEAQLTGARAALAASEKEIELELRQLISERDQAFRTLEEAKVDLELARQTRELASLRYQEGLALFSELEEATQTLAQAELAVAQAEFDLLLAVLRLEAACGRMPEFLNQE